MPEFLDTRSLVDLWIRASAQHGSRTMVERGTEAWTYGDLFQWSMRVASWLRKGGLAPDARVLILLGNGPEYVASYFGVLAAGGTVVALSPTAEAPELASAITQCEPWAAITHASREKELSSLRRIVVGRDADDACFQPGGAEWNDIVDRGSAATFEPVESELAQIIFTSGTSSRPKGVTLSHRNLLANIRSILSYLRLGAEDSVLAVLPFYYSYGNSVLLTHAAVGGRLIVGDLVFVSRALDLIDEKAVTGFAGVPSSFFALLHHSDFRHRKFRTLRYLTCAGGALAPSLIDELVRAQPGLELHVMYGQTEASPRLTSLPPSDAIRKRGSVGVPVPGVSLLVRMSSGEVCARGVTGEIYATGPNVMQGYWRDPDSTAEVLTTHGLRTGDLGHVDEDGYLYIDGRVSGVIKSEGYRVSPEEVEAKLLELEGIYAVAVAGLPDERWGEAITAFVQLQPGVQMDADLIIDYSKRTLPRHKQVRKVSFVDQLPKTSTGKLARSRLPTSV